LNFFSIFLIFLHIFFSVIESNLSNGIAETTTTEWLAKKADVLVALAECSMAEDKFDQAVEDLHEALAIRQRLVCGGVDEKGVAEVYYQLGQAQRNLSEVF
jgi:tetratricopeptide (TPR) repeat protein